MTFDTRSPDDEADAREVTVETGKGIRFAPGEFQHGYNDSDETVVGFAFGVPDARHDRDQIESLLHCRECEDEVRHGLELTDEGSFRMTVPSAATRSSPTDRRSSDPTAFTAPN